MEAGDELAGVERPAAAELADDVTVTGDLDPNHLPGHPSQADNSGASQSHYDLYKTLGAGAMGEIWLAKDAGLRRRVAYKRMHAHIAQHQSAMARFLREMQITAQLDHPNIVPVYECELNADGSLAYAMKLVKGKTLKDVLGAKKAKLEKGQDPGPEYSLSRLLEYFLSVCDAMAFAHSKGVIHRDLKPVNLMIGEFGEVYVMDWGIARRIGGELDELHGEDQDDPDATSEPEPSMDETQAGQILGTPRYMSPQQAAGKNDELDGRSDEFSLGLILFEILALRPAFSAKSALELVKKVLKVEVEPLEPYTGDAPIPRELKAIVAKALGRKPEQRYPGVAEMAADIRRWQQGLAVEASPDTPLQRVGRWISNHRQATLAAAFGVLLLVLSAVSISVYLQQAALARERIHTAYVNELFDLTSQQAQRIDSHFLRMQGLLSRIAGAAIQYIEQAPPSDEPAYPQHPFHPPGLIHSSLFGADISLDWPTSGFAPGKSLADMHGKLQRMLPLRHVFKETVLRSAVEHPETLGAAQVQEMIATTGTPIMWAHTSLAEGVIYMYPGIGFTTKGYDPRTRPFYTLAAHKHGIFWGAPYFDPLSGALLPCVTALYDHQGQFLGVSGIDLRFQYVIDHLLTLKHARVRRSYLLNAKGEIIIRSVDVDKKTTGSLSKGFETPPYPDRRLQTAIASGDGGGYLEEAGQLLIYSRLNTLGWYFVVESEPAMRARAGEARP